MPCISLTHASNRQPQPGLGGKHVLVRESAPGGRRRRRRGFEAGGAATRTSGLGSPAWEHSPTPNIPQNRWLVLHPPSTGDRGQSLPTALPSGPGRETLHLAFNMLYPQHVLTDPPLRESVFRKGACAVCFGNDGM